MKSFIHTLQSLFVLLVTVLPVHAQSDKIYSSHVHTLQTIVNDNWLLPPVLQLDSDDWLSISFDHLTHEYHRFTYHIVHCNADWQPSSLLEVDYLDGFNDQPIEDYANSLNTTMLYTHYRFELPNDDVSFKVSGNYKVAIYDEDADSDEPVAVSCFRIVDPAVTLHATISSNTDISTHTTHQQLSFTIHHPDYSIVNPDREVKAYVYQNHRTDNAVCALAPNYATPGVITYTHNKALIFNAANEYRRFEIINMYHSMQGVDNIRFFDPYFHAQLLDDAPRTNYSFDRDHNGRYLIRYDQADDDNTEADYLFVHFTLPIYRPLPGGQLYLQGQFTYNTFDPAYRMTYNAQEHIYEGTVLLKLGAYDYQYLWVPDDSTHGQCVPIEGDFYETENEYDIYIYHRPFGERYDHLIGVQHIRFSQEDE